MAVVVVAVIRPPAAAAVTRRRLVQAVAVAVISQATLLPLLARLAPTGVVACRDP
jgi:hypothetical protein